ncbi:MAG: O-antigen ligase family protein, partial [Anaerolineae bacterium]|nr:O-antigen ligase family protein [Anaerolineae bacterium]
MTTHPQATVSIQRALTRTLLLFLGAYLTMSGGTFAGLVFYQRQVINIGLVITGGLAWILWRWRAKRPFPVTALDWPLLAWVAAGLIASIFSIDPRVSLEHWVYQLVCVLIFFLMADLQQTGKSLETWIWITLIASVWFLYSGFNELFSWYARWFAIGGWADPIPPTTIRINGGIGHPNVLALYLNLLWPLALARLIKTRAWGLRIVLGIYISACFILLFFTSSRGGWMGTAAAISMFFLLTALDHRALVQHAWAGLRRRRWLLAGGVAVILLLAAVGGFLLYRQTQHPTHAQGDPRWYIWKVAVGMFLEDPLTGGGPGMYAFEFLKHFSIPPGSYLGHSHNVYFDALGETGLLGAASFLAIIFLSVRLLARIWCKTPTGNRLMMIGNIAAFSSLALHSIFESPQWTPLVSILLAALLAQIVAQEPVSPTRQPLRAATWLPAAAWLVISCLSFYSIRAYQRYAKADFYVQQGDYQTAAEMIESAASM